jgi:hypothetical protein
VTELRDFVTFDVRNLPDDPEFSVTGDIVIPAGRTLCKFLSPVFESKGMKVSRWHQHEFYGWEATLEIGGQRYWILLQGGEPWLLITERRGRLLAGKSESKTIFHKALTEIDAALKSDERLANVLWFTRPEYERGGQKGNPFP